MTIQEIEKLMRLAFAQAELAIKSKDAPFGAIATDKNGKVLAYGRNNVNSRVDPTAHAEISLLRQLAKKLKKVRFENINVFISSEPCSMCMSALVRSGIRHIYYGSAQEKKQLLYIAASSIAKKSKSKIFIKNNILSKESKSQVERGRKSLLRGNSCH